MIRRSVVLKLWVTIITVVVIVLFILAMYLEQFFNSYVDAMQRRDLTNQAILVSQILQQEPNQLLNSQITHVMSASHSHYYLVAPPAQSATVKHYLAQLSPNQRTFLASDQPIILQGVPSFVSSANPQTSLYALMPIVNSFHQVSAFLLIIESTQVTGNASHTIPSLIIFAVVLGTLLTTGLAFVVSQNLSTPLIEMNEAAEEMAKGRFDIRVRVMTQDEVGRLGQTFNHVATELEQTVRDLTREKEQIAGILSAMTDAVVVTDLSGRFTILNPAAKRWFRAVSALSSLENVGINWPPDLVLLQKDTLQSKSTIERSVQWNGRDMTVTMTPLYDPDNPQKSRGTLAVVRDITEQRRLDRLRKDFVANVSHELRTPLSLLQGYAEALLDDFGDNPEARLEITQIIHDEALRMRRLVNELLDLAQVEAGHFSMNLETIDFATLIRKVARKFQGVFAERKLELTIQIEQEPIEICGDSDRLEQVLTNLVDNAVRHTNKGGVTLCLTRKEQQAMLRITDTGEGISTEDLPFIFERFYKADKARTRGHGGTGLGLAIARSLIRSHHGDIGVRSTIDEGTTFTILLPTSRQPCEENRHM